jgi:hypothetical protein
MNENGNNLISLQNLQVHYDLGGGGLIDRIPAVAKFAASSKPLTAYL